MEVEFPAGEASEAIGGGVETDDGDPFVGETERGGEADKAEAGDGYAPRRFSSNRNSR